MNIQAQAVRLAAPYEETVREYRHHLHANPELSFEEVKTAAFIREHLALSGVPEEKGYSGNAVVGILDSGVPGPTIAFRADIDALPVDEDNDLPYKSTVPGVMHACGHDCHAAILLCLADLMSKNRALLKGKVKFIFQPGEEKFPGGAVTLCKEGVMKDVDFIFGCHVASGHPLGTISCFEGPSSGACSEFNVHILGKGGHSSAPDQALNPLPVACAVGTALTTLRPEKLSPGATAVLSVTTIRGGDPKYLNVIPDDAWVSGDTRALGNESMDTIFAEIKRMSEGICAAYGLTCDVQLTYGFPSCVNSEREVGIVHKAAETLGFAIAPKKLSMGAEDFAFYELEKPGAFFHVGVADPERPITSSPHHNCHFQIDERGLMDALCLEIAVYLQAIGA